MQWWYKRVKLWLLSFLQKFRSSFDAMKERMRIITESHDMNKIEVSKQHKFDLSRHEVELPFVEKYFVFE